MPTDLKRGASGGAKAAEGEKSLLEKQRERLPTMTQSIFLVLYPSRPWYEQIIFWLMPAAALICAAGSLTSYFSDKHEKSLFLLTMIVAFWSAIFVAVWLGFYSASRVPHKMAYEKKCIRCGYSLKGNPDATQCPECGAE